MIGSILNGLALGLLLFVIAVGLSLVFGLMDVLNLAHGSLVMLGAYLAFSLARPDSNGSFVVAVLAALVAGVASGVILHLMTRPLASRGHLDQALLTLGVSFVVAEMVTVIWGKNDNSVPVPPALSSGVPLPGGLQYPTYRFGVIVIGALIAFVVWFAFEKTTAGAIVRAAVHDRTMVAALGVNTQMVLLGTFALGTALATVGGVVGGPIVGASAGVDDRMMLLALIVVVIGGLGSIKGALVGGLVIGQVETLGVQLLPSFAAFALFAAMAVVLVVKPSGLFGPRAAVTK